MTIPGGSIQYVSSGEGVMLECLISGLTSPPMSICWEKGSKLMTVKERSGVSIETLPVLNCLILATIAMLVMLS